MNDFINELVMQKLLLITKHKEKLIEAWVAETGLHPSQSILCQRDNGDMTEFWIIKKPDPPQDEFGKDIYR